MWTASRRIEVPAETVWNILTAPDLWPVWGPTVSCAELAADGPLRLGSRGTVTTPLGVALPFQITAFRPGRMWAWKVAGVPGTRHGVESTATGCRVWMSSPVWAPVYVPVLAIALRRIGALAMEHKADTGQ
jgi:uncharacterized protein YndB with AHSA1/START domain